MNTFKKLTASILAIVSAASMVTSMTPAFAYEDIQSAKDAFVNSIYDVELKDVAQYLFDNDFSLEDAQKIIGASEKTTSMARTNINDDFYSSQYCFDVPHFAVIINHAPRFTLGNTMVTLSANSSYVNGFVGHGVAFPYDGYVGSYSTDAYVENDMVYCDETYRRVSAITDDNSARVLGKVYIDVNHDNIRSEADLYNRISMNYTLSTTQSTLSLEIFARGDITHSGLIDSADALLLAQYLTKVENGDSEPDSVLDLTYLDGDNHCSFAVNKIACDVDLDNDIDNDDLTLLNKYIAGIVEF